MELFIFSLKFKVAMVSKLQGYLKILMLNDDDILCVWHGG